ncbi:MAG: gfo/Idh/MocA family oxidoreductase, partial [Acidobacteria bacterium]
MAKAVNVALIGQGFMGRTHSNAYLKVGKFFTDLPAVPVMHTSYGMKTEDCSAFTSRWGWKHCSTDWEKTVRSDEIDLVDIVTPNFMHMPPALAALEAK